MVIITSYDSSYLLPNLCHTLNKKLFVNHTTTHILNFKKINTDTQERVVFLPIFNIYTFDILLAKRCANHNNINKKKLQDLVSK